jgi:hypothetical protein
MDPKELNGLMKAYMDVYQEETTTEPDPFGRPGGKYGGVPKKGSSYDRAIQANKKALENLDRKKANEEVELDEVTGFGGHVDPNTGKPLYPSGRAGYARRPDPSKDPRYGSHR